MPYKNDNLNELFQKAAEDYPLRIDIPNWDNVAAKLNTPSAETVVVRKTAIWKYAAILIMLLTGAAIIYDAQFDSTRTQKNIINTDVTKTSKSKISVQSQSQQSVNNTTSSQKDISLSTVEKPSINLNEYSSRINKMISNNSFHQLKPTATNQPTADLKTEKNNSTVNSINTQNNQAEDSKTQDQKANFSTLGNNSVIDQDKKDVTSPSSTTAIKAAETLVKYQAPPSNFYGSLYGGAEFSSIRGQKINNAGFKIGVALAYRINSRIDVEIGLQRERINYFTSGNYFNKSGLHVKDPFSLEKVDAASKLTSVPVTLRYNFKSKNNSHFYAGGGFNALVLTHSESYQYTVIKTDNGNINDKTKAYKSITGAKYFSSINMSAGYQAKLSNWCNFKVEPYYQLPIAKLGVGKLPVTNFGVNVGIVKDLK